MWYAREDGHLPCEVETTHSSGDLSPGVLVDPPHEERPIGAALALSRAGQSVKKRQDLATLIVVNRPDVSESSGLERRCGAREVVRVDAVEDQITTVPDLGVGTLV
jgi:hypothetical protein